MSGCAERCTSGLKRAPASAFAARPRPLADGNKRRYAGWGVLLFGGLLFAVRKRPISRRVETLGDSHGEQTATRKSRKQKTEEVQIQERPRDASFGLGQCRQGARRRREQEMTVTTITETPRPWMHRGAFCVLKAGRNAEGRLQWSWLIEKAAPALRMVMGRTRWLTER